MNNYEEIQSGIRSLELDSSEHCDGVLPVEDVKSLDTETSAKKEKEDNYEEIQSGIRSLELDSSEQSNGVLPVEDVKSVQTNGVVPMVEVKSVDTETSTKKEKEETNSVETDGEIEPPRRISEKVWKSYLSIRKFLHVDDEDSDDDYYDDGSGLPPLRPLFYGPAEQHNVSDEEDASMLESDHDLEMCTYDESIPCPGSGVFPGFIPISKIKENAIHNSLLIDHLAEGTGAEDLLKLFSIYGHVTRILIPTDKTTGRLESFGLVFFRNIDDAESALNCLNEEGYHVEWYVDEFDIVFRTTCRLVEYYYCE